MVHDMTEIYKSGFKKKCRFSYTCILEFYVLK